MIRIFTDGGGEAAFSSEVGEETLRAAMLGTKAALLHLETALKRRLTGQRSGRWYRVPLSAFTRSGARRKRRGRRWHQASAPGESPAVLFGRLRNSVTHRGPNRVGSLISGELGVGFGLVYARILEFGGVIRQLRKTGVVLIRIAPRPYLRPTWDQNIAKVDEILQRAIDPYFVRKAR